MSDELDLDDSSSKGRGSGLAIGSGLIWLALIGATWYLYRGGAEVGGLAAFVGRFHPLIVHMPIGLLFGVFAIELLSLIGKGKRFRPAVSFLLWISVLSALAASFLGYLLMEAEDYAGRLVDLHMWTGLGMALVSVMALFFQLRQSRFPYYLSLLASLGLMSAAGHFGGAMVHGSTYLSQYAPESLKPILDFGLVKREADLEADGGEGVASSGGGESAGEDVPAEKPLEEQVVFTKLVLPVLEAKCNECHNEDKIKGKLRMDTYELLMAGATGSDFATVEAGNSEDSELVFRASLDPDDDEFMPPDGKEPFTEGELAMIRWWIDQGASEVASVAELEPDEAMRSILTEVHTSLGGAAETALSVPIEAPVVGVWETLPPEEQKARLEAASKAAKEAGFNLMQISAEDERLQVSTVNAVSNFGDEQLAALEPVSERIVRLDLADTTVSDKGMASIAKMGQLEWLNLSNTKVSDLGLRQVAGLERLKYLNLYGTEVTEAIFEPLADLRELRKLYLWKTAVDPGAARDFQRSMSLEVNLGQELAARNLPPKGEEAVEDQAKAEPASASPPKAEPKPKPQAEKKKEVKASPEGEGKKDSATAKSEGQDDDKKDKASSDPAGANANKQSNPPKGEKKAKKPNRPPEAKAEEKATDSPASGTNQEAASEPRKTSKPAPGGEAGDETPEPDDGA